MAVGTQDHALACFGSRGGQRARDTGRADGKTLGVGVEMVEVQCGNATVVAAEHARATGFVEQDLLDASPSLADRDGPAGDAPQATATTDMTRRAVNRARQHRLVRLRRQRQRALITPSRHRALDPIPPQPMPHRRRTALHHRRDLPDRPVFLHQSSQPRLVDPTTRRVPRAVGRPQPVPLRPIRHLRRRAAQLAGDRRIRVAAGEPLGEPGAVDHGGPRRLACGRPGRAGILDGDDDDAILVG